MRASPRAAVQVPTLSWDTFFGGEHAHSADGDERLYIKIDIEGLAFRIAIAHRSRSRPCVVGPQQYRAAAQTPTAQPTLNVEPAVALSADAGCGRLHADGSPLVHCVP